MELASLIEFAQAWAPWAFSALLVVRHSLGTWQDAAKIKKDIGSKNQSKDDAGETDEQDRTPKPGSGVIIVFLLMVAFCFGLPLLTRKPEPEPDEPNASMLASDSAEPPEADDIKLDQGGRTLRLNLKNTDRLDTARIFIENGKLSVDVPVSLDVDDDTALSSFKELVEAAKEASLVESLQDRSEEGSGLDHYRWPDGTLSKYAPNKVTGEKRLREVDRLDEDGNWVKTQMEETNFRVPDDDKWRIRSALYQVGRLTELLEELRESIEAGAADPREEDTDLSPVPRGEVQTAEDQSVTPPPKLPFSPEEPEEESDDASDAKAAD